MSRAYEFKDAKYLIKEFQNLLKIYLLLINMLKNTKKK